MRIDNHQVPVSIGGTKLQLRLECIYRNAGSDYHSFPGFARCESPSEIHSAEQTPSKLSGLYC